VALDKFIEKYVLCPKCTYPEMNIKVKKGIVHGNCDSCGNATTLDNIHKMAQFIVKNPPNSADKEDPKNKKKALKVIKMINKKLKSLKNKKKKRSKSLKTQKLLRK